jgi:uncharacterized protein (TIGR02679 family)
MSECVLCGGACSGAELGPLLDARLGWLWEQIGRAADRRGDAALMEGSLLLRAPVDAAERAAAAGLVGGRVLKQGQTRRVDLRQLTTKLHTRGPHLTPGAAAAHALGRRLAMRADADAQRWKVEQELFSVFLDASKAVPSSAFREHERVWAALRRSGWIARLVAADEPKQFLRTAMAVIEALPHADTRRDRRHLAADVTGNPHALDHGTPLASAVMALLVASGVVKPRLRLRDAWASVAVNCDDVVGGLIAVGIRPVGWTLPPGTTVTLPPRELQRCSWPTPDAAGAWVFVTENPSIASAAADLDGSGDSIRLLCTIGTPAAAEITAMARIASAGWRVAVRADFDAAGLSHVAATLKGVPGAVPWRMGVDDYLQSVAAHMTEEVALQQIPDVPWEPCLAAAMRDRGVAAFEESLLGSLLEDLRRGALPES